MLWINRFLCVGVMCGILAGCMQHPEWALPKESLSTFITDKQEPRVTRLQIPDGPPVTLKKPTMLQELTPPVIPGPPPGAEIRPTSLSARGTVQVSIRAWVNNRPIFDREVIEMARPQLARLGGMFEPQRSEEMTKVINFELNKIIDAELMFQDAVKKLEKGNPQALNKLKEYVDHEFDKTLQRLRNAKLSEADIREIEPIARRMLERDLISMEYARSRIVPGVQSKIGLQEIRDYYEAHKNEYVSKDRVIWQDIYIPVNENLPKVEDLKRYAEELINRCLQPGDFDKLMIYNEGDSKLRNGLGLGERRGEIQPADLEEHVLQLREGEIGPVVPFARGVHLIRVTKREYARRMPLDEKIQKEIRKDLEKQLADREYKRIARELRLRAVVRIEREGL